MTAQRSKLSRASTRQTLPATPRRNGALQVVRCRSRISRQSRPLMTLIGVGAGRRQMEDDADAEFVCAVVPSDMRSPPGWAEAFARAADLVVGEAATADDVLRDYGRLA